MGALTAAENDICIHVFLALNTVHQYVRWLRSTVGRTPVFGRRTALGLQPTGDNYVGKPSAIGQPTRPTQPFILPGSIKE